jgi:hypothetical protein
MIICFDAIGKIFMGKDIPEEIFEIEVKFDLDTFNKQKQLWKESNVKNYKFVYQTLCCKDEIFVKDGENVKHESNPTIDKIFEEIENAFYKSNKKRHSPNDLYLYEIDVEYDEINHIPIEYNYHFNNDLNDIIDDVGFVILIKDFEKIKV